MPILQPSICSIPPLKVLLATKPFHIVYQWRTDRSDIFSRTSGSFDELRQDLSLERSAANTLQVDCIFSVIHDPDTPMLIELRENVQQLKLSREERMIDQSLANKELIRNLGA